MDGCSGCVVKITCPCIRSTYDDYDALQREDYERIVMYLQQHFEVLYNTNIKACFDIHLFSLSLKFLVAST